MRNQSVKQSVSQTVNQPVSQLVNQSINQSVNQSVNHHLVRVYSYLWPPLLTLWTGRNSPCERSSEREDDTAAIGFLR